MNAQTATQQATVHLGPPVVPFYRFFLGEGSPKIDYRKKKRKKHIGYPDFNLSSGGPSFPQGYSTRKKGTLILASL